MPCALKAALRAWLVREYGVPLNEHFRPPVRTRFIDSVPLYICPGTICEVEHPKFPPQVPLVSAFRNSTRAQSSPLVRITFVTSIRTIFLDHYYNIYLKIIISVILAIHLFENKIHLF